MAPKIKVTKEDIIKSGLALVREDGESGLNARAVAQKIGCSTQPIFSNYSLMEDLKKDIIAAAEKLYLDYTHGKMNTAQIPPYKASGLAYIQFAKDETNLFKLLFMRNRRKETESDNENAVSEFVDIVAKNTNLSREDAYMFHLEMWVYVHGIASMIATSYLEWDEETISKMLTDAYIGLKRRYCDEQNS